MTNAKKPSKDNGLITKFKLWLFKKEWINKVKYKNQDGGNTYLVRKKSHAKKTKTR